MGKLKTLRPAVQILATSRIKPLVSARRRVSGNTRIKLKCLIYVRDGGRCCMCKRLVDLHESELDHRIGLQFGGDNAETNLWTLCVDCHERKTAREMASGQPDEEAMCYPEPQPVSVPSVVL
ncbi:HNH endonuclease [Serratia marcescens]|nr:HNH endonuclease [Serratia marcescens]